MRLLFLLLFLPLSAEALQVAESSLRIEDEKTGNLVLGSDHAVIEVGEIYGTVLLLWGNLDVHGEVKEVVVLSGHVVFHETAKLTKSLTVMGGSFESKAGASMAAESVVFREPGPLWRALRSATDVWREHLDWVVRAVFGLISCLLLWLFGWALFRGMPGFQNALAIGRDWPKNLVVGVLGSLLVPVFFVLLVISILGIFLLPVYFFCLLLAGVLAHLAAALWAGNRLLPPRPGEKLRPLSLLLGLGALHLLWTVGVWWAWLPALALWTVGWGALLRAMRTLWR